MRPPSQPRHPTAQMPRHRAPRRTLAARLRRPLRVGTAIFATLTFVTGSATLYLAVWKPATLEQITTAASGGQVTQAQEAARDRAVNRANRSVALGGRQSLGGAVTGDSPWSDLKGKNRRTPTAKPTTATPTPKATQKPSPKPKPKPVAKAAPKPAPKPAAPTRLADGRPVFALPFKCGQRWRFTTYAGHNPEDAKIDFFYDDGETRGQPVLASAAGTVSKLLPEIGAVKIEHGQGWTTMYNHMDPIMVEVGQKLAQGDQIGRAGSVDTGVAHVHYEQIFDSNGDNYGSSPAEIVQPIIQGVKYSLHEGDDQPVVASKNSC